MAPVSQPRFHGSSPTIASDLVSIRLFATKDGEGVTVRASEFYALFLSLGAKGGGGDTGKPENFVMRRITRRKS